MTADRWQSPCGRMELRLGDYREALVDVQADHCITDPPYSARTHGGHNAMRSHKAGDGRRDLSYQHWTGVDVAACVARFNVPGWLVAFTDHVLAVAWEAHATP